MATATLTSKGQEVIPKSVRDRLCLHSGDQLEFLVQESGDLVVRPAVIDVIDLYGLLFKPDRKPVSVEDMKRAVRRRTAKKVCIGRIASRYGCTETATFDKALKGEPGYRLLAGR